MNNCYELTLKYIQILADIDRLIEKKSKTSNIDENIFLDKEITRAEVELFDIRDILKNKNIY